MGNYLTWGYVRRLRKRVTSPLPRVCVGKFIGKFFIIGA